MPQVSAAAARKTTKTIPSRKSRQTSKILKTLPRAKAKSPAQRKTPAKKPIIKKLKAKTALKKARNRAMRQIPKKNQTKTNRTISPKKVKTQPNQTISLKKAKSLLTPTTLTMTLKIQTAVKTAAKAIQAQKKTTWGKKIKIPMLPAALPQMIRKTPKTQKAQTRRSRRVPRIGRTKSI